MSGDNPSRLPRSLSVDLHVRQPGLEVQAQLRALPGRVSALVGREENGQRAILEAVAGLRPAIAGRVALGADALYESRRGLNLPPRRRRLGWLDAQAHLFPHLTIEHNLAYGARALGARMQVAPGLDIPALVKWLDPSAMLERRPHELKLEAGFQAAQQRLGVAQKAWFPTFSLTATLGTISTALSGLFAGGSFTYTGAPSVSLPLFDGGRLRAGVQSAAAQADEAAARYREQLLLAFKDVEDHFSGLSLLAAQSQVQARAVASAQRALHLSDSRYRNGLVSQLELLDARRSELRNRRQALQVRTAQYQATVGLIRALGGGWPGA